jgi:hypothetical protein
MKTDFQERIDEYILGRMSEADKAQFEEEISCDKSKKEHLDFTQNVKSTICSREEKLARMREMQCAYNQKHYKPAQLIAKKYRRIWVWTSGIAAVLVIGLLVVNPFGNNISPIESSSNEIIRGQDNDVFDMKSDSLISDSILSHDTVRFFENIKLNK